jgi:tetratricopeptide (TPR) repeat protein
VRRAEDRLRFTAQLINVEDGYHLWAETYDRDLRDVFAVQEEIAQAIVGALRVKLTGEATAIVVRPTADLTAYDLYLKGRHAVNQRRGESLVQAAGYFEQAIARDPSFAQAYAGLADAYVLLPGYNVTNSSEAWPKSRAAAQRALALDSTLAEAHTTLAYGTFMFERDWRAAEEGFRRAIALNPGYATAHHWYGDFLGGRGDLEGYLQEIRLAHALDPLSQQIGTEVGRALWALRRSDEAVTQLQQVLGADPAFAEAHVTLGRVYIQQGRLAEAIGAFRREWSSGVATLWTWRSSRTPMPWRAGGARPSACSSSSKSAHVASTSSRRCSPSSTRDWANTNAPSTGWTAPPPNAMVGSLNPSSIQPTTRCARTRDTHRCFRPWG